MVWDYSYILFYIFFLDKEETIVDTQAVYSTFIASSRVRVSYK